MKKYLPILLIIFFTLFLIPQEQLVNETQMKYIILEEDLEQTRSLCKTQHRKILQNFLREKHAQYYNTTNPAFISSLLALKKENSQIEQLLWIDSSKSLQHAKVIGDLSKELELVSISFKEEALQFLKRQKREKLYQSPSIINVDNNEYFVLGINSNEEGPYLLALIHQHLVNEITVEQKKNLRLLPHPSDHRINIQSVDSETLHPTRVENLENNDEVSHYYNQQVIVSFNKNPSIKQLNQIENQIQSSKHVKLGNSYVFQSKLFQTDRLIDYFQRNWDIRYAEPNFLYLTNNKASFHPNDALFQRHQWNLPIIETLRGWDLSKGSEEIVVAVIDTGVDLSHPDLTERLVQGANFINQTKPPIDDVGHGTHVTGIISAIVNNEEGVAGMSWYNKVMPIKSLDHSGAGSSYSVAQGIIWAVDQGAHVINMSLGNYADSEFLHDAVKYAFDRDVILVAATGNDNTENPGFPAAYEEVLAVGATNRYQYRAGFSNYGHYLDVTAPGEQIASTYPNNQYAALSGTSMASPHVSALAAMIRTVNPSLSNVEVMNIIRYSSLDLGIKGHDKHYGYGQIDVEKALKQATGIYEYSDSSPIDSLSDRIEHSFFEKVKILLGLN